MFSASLIYVTSSSVNPLIDFIKKESSTLIIKCVLGLDFHASVWWLFVPPPRPHAAGSDCSLVSPQHLYTYSTDYTNFSFSWLDGAYVTFKTDHWWQRWCDSRLPHTLEGRMNSVYTANAELKFRLVIKTKCFSTIEFHLLANKKKDKTNRQHVLDISKSINAYTDNFAYFLLMLSKCTMKCQNTWTTEALIGGDPPMYRRRMSLLAPDQAGFLLVSTLSFTWMPPRAERSSLGPSKCTKGLLLKDFWSCDHSLILCRNSLWAGKIRRGRQVSVTTWVVANEISYM